MNTWHFIVEIPKQNEEMSNRLSFQGTTDKQALHIKELLDINTETEMNTKYQKYIDLLNANKNLILTGAPGTGKTFMAKGIAKAMGCEDEEIGFVQFHPSYDYTDFVEGLRPIKDDNGNVGFERKDGVFKEFCKRALTNEANIHYSNEEALARFKHDLKEKGSIEIPSYLKSSVHRIVTLTDNGSIGVIGDSVYPYGDDRILKYMRERDRDFLGNDTYL